MDDNIKYSLKIGYQGQLVFFLVAFFVILGMFALVYELVRSTDVISFTILFLMVYCGLVLRLAWGVFAAPYRVDVLDIGIARLKSLRLPDREIALSQIEQITIKQNRLDESLLMRIKHEGESIGDFAGSSKIRRFVAEVRRVNPSLETEGFDERVLEVE